MDNRELEIFLTLADTLHFGRTSQICHISPSALSRSIKQLEEKLNTTLFIRDNRSVLLTHEGKLFQEYARESLQHWEIFRDTLQRESGELKGEISIYCSVTASYSFLYQILSQFRQAHPGIEIKLHTGDPAQATQRVLSGQEDLAIAPRPPKPPSNLDFNRIAITPLVFIAPRPENQEPALLQALENQSWRKVPMILSEEGLIRDRLDQWFRQKHIKPNIYAQVAGHEAIVSMVSLGFGVGVVPKIVIDNSPLANQVQQLPDHPKLEDYDVGLCALKKRLKSPLVRAFWEQLKQGQ